jgi:erythromycin esterase-like protein
VASSDFRNGCGATAVVLDFITDLRERNDALPPEERAGFTRLDLYSLHGSVQAVIAYLDAVDPEAANAPASATTASKCSGRTRSSTASPPRSASRSRARTRQSINSSDLQRRAGELAGRDGQQSRDEFFFAEQNARLVADAENTYRAMFRGRENTWNLRDTHMADTLDALDAHLSRRTGPARKIVVWAHNSHLGDARATEMSERGELNLGQLVRERHGGERFLVGFSTFAGTVTAASDWGGRPSRCASAPAFPVPMRPAAPGERGREPAISCSPWPVRSGLADVLAEPRLQRAIGVIYQPRTERWSHYFHTRLPDQFDALLHFGPDPRGRAVGAHGGLGNRRTRQQTYPTGI